MNQLSDINCVQIFKITYDLGEAEVGERRSRAKKKGSIPQDGFEELEEPDVLFFHVQIVLLRDDVLALDGEDTLSKAQDSRQRGARREGP